MAAFQMHSPGTHWIRHTLSAALLVLAGLLAVLDARADGWGPETVLENVGEVCVRRRPAGSGVELTFRSPPGCVSSSCTRVLAQDFTATALDGDVREIAMNSRFVVQTPSRPRVCTMDCGGGGHASVVLADLPAGAWRLTLGGQEIGQIDTAELAPGRSAPRCFSHKPRD